MKMCDTQVNTLGGGNTKTPPRYRKYIFTLNNWSQEEYEYIVKCLTLKHGEFIIGEEIGENGTPHLQGFVKFKNAIQFNTIKQIMPRAHIERARGTIEENKIYCSKEKIKICTLPIERKEKIIKYIYDKIVWKEWQQKIIDIAETKPDDRTINWVWDKMGNSGKSFLAKYLVVKYNALVCSGKKSDIFHEIKLWLEMNPHDDPKIIIMDVPRHNTEYINYGCLEEIKNGMLYSGKYEGGICVFFSPHVFVFANIEPDYTKMSNDRWNVIELE